MKATSKILRVAFVLLILLSAVFYLLADFGKTLTVYYGIVQIVMLVPSLFLIKKNNLVSVVFISILLTTNMAPFIFWIMESGAWFLLFGVSITSNIPLMLFHLAILGIGICEVLFVVRLIQAKKDNQPKTT